jgi:hypothetical protein
MPTAPGQYAPNSRVESLAREHYKSAQVGAFITARAIRFLMFDTQDAAQNAKKLLELDKAFAGEQVLGRKMKAQFHSSRWSRTILTE